CFSHEEVGERWKKTGSPYSASVNEQQIYDRFFGEAAEHGDDPKMVVLGVTPELRKLGHKYGYQVTCVDFSPMWINAMDILMGEEGERDIIVRCNWLETPLEKGRYDVVVGDGSINMVELKDWDRLLKIIHDLLKPGGYFITRTLVGMKDPIPLPDALKGNLRRSSTSISR
ncbi:MAG: class I SAM-dependent methyltransferase, partial [Candidatus Bathyarchaeia archaeon]